MAQQHIELDCGPFQPRPGALIEWVLKDTTLPLRTANCMRFGLWTWEYTDIPADQWQLAIPTIKNRICDLFNSKQIRYGAWE